MTIFALTKEQTAWLDAHPNYQSVGKPRPDVKFVDCGTLHPNGIFERLGPMKPIRLTAGPPYAIGVGIRVHPNT